MSAALNTSDAPYTWKVSLTPDLRLVRPLANVPPTATSVRDVIAPPVLTSAVSVE